MYSELELVTALLRHQENDSELAMHRRKMGPAFVAPGHEAWGVRHMANPLHWWQGSPEA